MSSQKDYKSKIKHKPVSTIDDNNNNDNDTQVLNHGGGDKLDNSDNNNNNHTRFPDNKSNIIIL